MNTTIFTSPRRYYYIYKVTNKLTNEYYVGQHSSTKEPLHDTYMGSGIQIKQALKRYGTHNFTKEIVQLCENTTDLNVAELIHIGDKWFTDPLCLNMKAGGEAGRGWTHTIEARRNISIHNKGKKHPLSAASIAKMAATLKTLRWWNNGKINKRCSQCPGDDFMLGRLTYSDFAKARTGQRWWNNGKVNTRAFNKPGDDFVLGRLPYSDKAISNFAKARTGQHWWNNGIITKQSKIQPGPDWIPGRI